MKGNAGTALEAAFDGEEGKETNVLPDEPALAPLDGKRKKLVALVTAGMKQTDVAGAMGCTDGYISQLLGEELVQKHLQRLRAESSVRRVLSQKKYDKVEDSLLVAIEGQIGTAEMKDLTRALEVVSKCNPRSRGQLMQALGDSGGTQIIAVQLPTFVQQSLLVEKNARNEITQIGDQSMQSLSQKDFYKKMSVSAQDAQEV